MKHGLLLPGGTEITQPGIFVVQGKTAWDKGPLLVQGHYQAGGRRETPSLLPRCQDIALGVRLTVLSPRVSLAFIQSFIFTVIPLFSLQESISNYKIHQESWER